MRLMSILKSVVFAVPMGAAAGLAAAPPPAPAPADPVVHENLAVYFLHGHSQAGPVPLTLAEALARGGVTVHETKRVNELEIENTGREAVFVQAGDIVKGGAQDRVLTVSLLLPAKSGRIPINAFCVEQGRWAARGSEQVNKFASADKAVPSREAKIAMFAPLAAKPAAGPDLRTAAGRATGDETAMRQSGVWESVAAATRKLSSSLGAPVAAAESASSLQLALENKQLDEARSRYIAALKPAGEASGEIVGFVIAVNGKINSAEVYPSNALFRKMWPKMVEAAATEAIAEKADAAAASAPPPARADVARFLAAAETGQAEQAPLTAGLQRARHDAEKAVMQETRTATGGLVHRNYLAK